MAQRSQDFVLAALGFTMERMHCWILLILIAALPSMVAAEDFFVEREAPVFQSTSTDSKVFFHLQKGEKVQGEPTSNDEFYRVRVVREEKWRTGFVAKTNLTNEKGEAVAKKWWGAGAGYLSSSLSQKGKSFVTQSDQVQYTTSEFKGSWSGASVSFQLREENFWRVSIAQKKAVMTATATTNVGGPAKDLELRQTILSASLQKAWTPLSTKKVYIGVGGEVNRATALDFRYGTVVMPTDKEVMPSYAGLQAFLGGQFFVSKAISLYGEARFIDILNQSPNIMIYEGTAGVLYWP